ncbi:hypothetical protein LCGC14_2987580, partial [marine sediment metagenome]
TVYDSKKTPLKQQSLMIKIIVKDGIV